MAEARVVVDVERHTNSARNERCPKHDSTTQPSAGVGQVTHSRRKGREEGEKGSTPTASQFTAHTHRPPYKCHGNGTDDGRHRRDTHCPRTRHRPGISVPLTTPTPNRRAPARIRVAPSGR